MTNSSTTFSKLIKSYNRVEIPVIQRDYAQGRAEEQIVRDDFLKTLLEAMSLPKNNANLPIDLDFIYGSVENGAFQPLDGQQRLTTLFLMHWYLAWVDERIDDFHDRFVSKDRSRFGYEVRPSSRDFINSLACFTPKMQPSQCPNLIEMITDQPWYFRNWKFDPTVGSSLNMLSQMHSMFSESQGLYARLMDEDAPAITFQLLDLDQFDLSDDLYIKMNARGKPLTPFETFKARFERHLEKEFDDSFNSLCGDMPVSQFFSDRIDTRWSDFFWPFRDKITHSFDNAVMNLLRSIIMVTRLPDADGVSRDLSDLRNSSRANNYSWFHEKGWLDQKMVTGFIILLERWSAGQDKFHRYLPDNEHLDEFELFTDIIARPSGLTFEGLVQFAGYLQYITHADDTIDADAFNAWMRVVSNLAINTEYNRPDDLRRSFASLSKLTPFMDNILSHLATSDVDVGGFSGEQVAEERIKAHLITIGEGWPERIKIAESDPYFRGQIGFLLRFSGVDLDNVNAEIDRIDKGFARQLCKQFDHYLTCATHMLDSLVNDEQDTGRNWERALLAIGNYLLQTPFGVNFSLLVTARDVHWSWKRLLRDAAANGEKGLFLKELWNRLSKPDRFKTELAKIIDAKSGIERWRACIIDTPAVYDYGQNRMLRLNDKDHIYILKRTQMNGAHAELFTYCLYYEMDSKLIDHSFGVDYYHSSTTDEEPSLELTKLFKGKDIEFSLALGSEPGVYELCLDEPKELEPKLKTLLENEGFQKVNNIWTKLADQKDIKSVVLSLDKALDLSS